MDRERDVPVALPKPYALEH